MRFQTSHLAAVLALSGLALFAEEVAVRLEPSRLSLGRFPANSPPAAELFLVNDGDKPLEDIRVRTGCGCIAAVAEGDSVAQGGRLRIRVSALPEQAAGSFSHSVFVEAGNELLRASVTGEAAPLFAVRPGNAFSLGELVCGAPFKAEFRLDAGQPVTLGEISASQMEVELTSLPTASFRIVLRGTVPEGPGPFRRAVSVPVASPEGWRPIELVVYGNAIKNPEKEGQQ